MAFTASSLSRNVLAAICSDGPVFPFRFAPGGSLANATFTRASTGTYVDANGIVQTASSNVARDANYINGVRTLLLESQRTNVALQSQDLSQWTNSVLGAAVTLAAGTAPDGTNTANSIVFGTGDFRYQNFNLGSAILGLTYTFPIWVWSPSKATIGLRIVNAGTGSDSTFTAVNLTAGATRVSVPCTFTGAGNVISIGLDNRAGFGGDGLAGTALAWGGQLEAGAFATSYIPTTVASVTRAVDALSFPGVTVSGTATLFYRYYNLATAAFVDVAAAYTSGTTITPPVDRAYQIIAVLNGTLSAAACAALLGVP